MRIILMIGVLSLITSCSAIKPEYEFTEKDLVAVFQQLDTNDNILQNKDNLILAAFREIEARIRAVEARLKIPSPPLPTPVPTVNATSKLIVEGAEVKK